MVALKDYRPNNLSINPFQLGQEIAKPYDYDGALKEMMNWQQLTNQEATTDFNQLKAEEAQREADFSDARKAELEKRIAEGGDASEFKMSDVEKVIGNTEGYLKLRAEERKALQDSEDRNLKIGSTLNTIGKTNPAYAIQLANERKIGDFRAPVEKGDKPKDPKPPKTQPWTNGKTVTLVDENNAAEVAKARADKLMPLKAMPDSIKQTIDPFGGSGGGEPEAPASPEDSVGMFDKFMRGLNGDGNKAVNPGNAATPPSPAPPGMKWQRSNLGNFKLVPR